ncbi:MAG: DUF3352 domain-containing protein [Caldilineaceae bacterium]|nr:DUF3352 domain-containing protein [Caldilineaceae bacterium]
MVIKILAAIAAVAVVVVVAAGLAMYFRLIPIPGPILALLVGAKEPEYSARYYPPDTLAYGWVTLAPSGGQFENMRDIWERFNEFRDFRRLVDDWQDNFEDETGIDFETDVEPWIGPEASIAFIDFNFRRDELIIAAAIGVRDEDAARDFLGRWLEYMEDTEGADFDRDSYKGFDVWADESEHQAYGLSKDVLLFSTTESGLEEVIDGISGDLDRSLADNEQFQAAREALPDRRFASFYVDYQEGIELIEDFSPDEFGNMGIRAFGEQEPEWIAGSAGWSERAISIETVMPLGIDYPLEVANLDDPAHLVASDTLGFMAMTFDPDVDRWRDAARNYDVGEVLSPSDIDDLNDAIEAFSYDVDILNLSDLDADARLDELLDWVLDFVEGMTDIDLEDDLLANLAGEAIFAVSDVDFTRVADDPLSNAVDAVAMLSYHEEKEAGLTDTMDDVTDIIEDNLFAFLEIDSVRMGVGPRATVFGIRREFVETGYAPGYVLYDGYLTIGSTEEALETTVELQDGEGRSLASMSEYARIVGHLPTQRQSLTYVNLQRIIRQFEPEDFDMAGDEFDILETSLGAVAVSTYSPHCLGPAYDYPCLIPGGTDVTRITAVLTLFPE